MRKSTEICSFSRDKDPNVNCDECKCTQGVRVVLIGNRTLSAPYVTDESGAYHYSCPYTR